MKLTHDGKRFIFTCRYTEREVPKEAGFRWEIEKKCWMSDDPRVAVQLAKYADEKARAVIRTATDAAVENFNLRSRWLAAYSASKPSGLYEHQHAGVCWLLNAGRGILADDLGLGKTRQALLAAKATELPTVVVGPAGLRDVWQQEAAIVHQKIEYHSWAKVPDAPVGYRFALIADEAHYAQSLGAHRTKKLLMLAEKADCVWLLTGTPIKNGRPVNLFPLLKACRHRLATKRSHYEIHYCNAHATRWTRWDVSGASNLDELHREIADVMLRRTKAECLDLPEKTRVIRGVDLSEKALATYVRAFTELQDDYQRRKEAGEISEADALVLLNHARHAGSLAKVEAAVELAEEVVEEGGQVVLFTAFVHPAMMIAEAIADGDPHAVGVVRGETSPSERTKAIADFQAGKTRALICTFGAGGVGVTLTAAQTVILVDRPWTPGDAVQAEDRLHRIGQQNAVTAVWLQATKVDHEIDELLQTKQKRAEMVLAGEERGLPAEQSIVQLAEDLFGRKKKGAR